MGLLLGLDLEGVLEVEDCFALPGNETGLGRESFGLDLFGSSTDEGISRLKVEYDSISEGFEDYGGNPGEDITSSTVDQGLIVPSVRITFRMERKGDEGEDKWQRETGAFTDRPLGHSAARSRAGGSN